ncbi:MAG: sulfoxide reductase heme-binding subunit YedZ [Chromatiales bacterium]|nr:sulfoxide reductase heme-binding subunit YedZ [Chromatiales bacterium]MDX9768708.1 protein-methionine-sulfoxide reductase heme-binding subunit MsrQ [Ectothiorhodospiraceae bacterium]
MRTPTSTPVWLWWARAATLALCLAPAAVLLHRALTDGLGAEPVEAVLIHTGTWGLRFLLLTLAVTPLCRLTGWRWPVRLRRMLGLASFFWLVGHFGLYLGLDQGFDWPAIAEDLFTRLPQMTGFAALLLLIPLAITSTDAMQRRLGGRRWKRLHRLIYPAAILGVLHFALMVKADLQQPLLHAAVLVVLLGWRLRSALALRRSRQTVTGRGPSL